MEPSTPPKEIFIEFKDGKIRVDGAVVSVIMYLAQHSAFFNDRRTVGNFTLLCKDGNQTTKNEMTMQP